jgi:hypothetical protein
MNVKSKEEDLWSPSSTMPCWYIDEGNHSLASVNI